MRIKPGTIKLHKSNKANSQIQKGFKLINNYTLENFFMSSYTKIFSHTFKIVCRLQNITLINLENYVFIFIILILHIFMLQCL